MTTTLVIGASGQIGSHLADLLAAQGQTVRRATSRVATQGGDVTVNLGTGRGHSVLEVAKAFEKASGRPVPVRIVERRAGDIAACWADPALARETLGWSATRDLAQMCEDSWRWQSANPQGVTEG